ncbi:GTPase ObgE, partial [Vibrio metschnikovii]
LADFMETLPRQQEEISEEQKVEFMWNDYHKDAIANQPIIDENDDDDDWDDEEDDGHVIYVRE